MYIHKNVKMKDGKFVVQYLNGLCDSFVELDVQMGSEEFDIAALERFLKLNHDTIMELIQILANNKTANHWAFFINDKIINRGTFKKISLDVIKLVAAYSYSEGNSFEKIHIAYNLIALAIKLAPGDTLNDADDEWSFEFKKHYKLAKLKETQLKCLDLDMVDAHKLKNQLVDIVKGLESSGNKKTKLWGYDFFLSNDDWVLLEVDNEKRDKVNELMKSLRS